MSNLDLDHIVDGVHFDVDESLRSQSTLTILRFNRSGLGDRLCGIVLLCAYAMAKGYKTVRIPWPSYTPPDGNPAVHRKIDIVLRNVLDNFVVPSFLLLESGSGHELRNDGDVVFTPDPGTAYFWAEVGHGMLDFEWLRTRYLPEVSRLQMIEVAKIVLSEFSFIEPIKKAVNELPEKFCAIHIRRTDKIRDVVIDTNLISRSEVHALNEQTRRLIRKYRDEGFEYFFVCSDDDTAVPDYYQYIQSVGGEVVKLPSMAKHVATYYDLAAMSKAHMIIQSSYGSAFSYFAAGIGHGFIHSAHSEFKRAITPSGCDVVKP